MKIIELISDTFSVVFRDSLAYFHFFIFHIKSACLTSYFKPLIIKAFFIFQIRIQRSITCKINSFRKNIVNSIHKNYPF